MEAFSTLECNNLTGVDLMITPSVYIILGIIFWTAYIPCLYVMVMEGLRNVPCFNIMAALGVCDLVNLGILCFCDGTASLLQLDYCDYKMAHWCLGIVANGSFLTFI